MVNVYSIFILEEPRTTVYEKLIDYALSKSDAFMLATARQYDYDIVVHKPSCVWVKEENFIKRVISNNNKNGSYYWITDKDATGGMQHHARNVV